MTNVSSSKLLPKYIGPFRVLRRQGNAYTIELHVGCVHILRFMWGVSARTVSTSLLPTMKTTPTFKNLHQILALALQEISLIAS